MKLFHAIEGIMVKLGELPGLSFLSTFVSEHQQERMRREKTLLKYGSYVQSLRGAAKEVNKLGHGGGHDEHGASAHGKRKHSRAKDERIEDDVDEFEEDYTDEDDDFESYML